MNEANTNMQEANTHMKEVNTHLIVAKTNLQEAKANLKVAKINMKVASCNDDIDFIVKDIMMYKLGLEESQLIDSAQLQDDLGVDSLDILELQVELEKQFDIKISEEEAERMDTVAKVVRCVQNKMR